MTVDEVKQKTRPILEQHGVAYAGVFGGVARGQDGPQSDVDILVRLGRPMGMVEYMDLIQSLEEILQKKVDLVTDQSLNQRVRPYVTPDLTTSMRKDNRVYLEQILDAADKIHRFVAGMGQDAFLDDQKTQSAVIMQLALIGELAKRISDPPRRQIVLDGARREMVAHCPATRRGVAERRAAQVD